MLSQYLKFLSHVLAITGLLVLVFLYLWRLRFQNHKMKGLMSPEPYGALPILGHLHQLGGRNPLFQTLANMADKYGPIFTIWLGKNRALVISNYEAAKECFTTNDRVFATRPSSAQGKYLGYNYAAFGVSPYGKYWRDMRKLVVMELLSSRRLETLKHVQISEVDAFVKGLYSVWKNKGHDGPSKVVISKGIEHLTCNVMTKIIAGKRNFGVKSDEFDGEVKKIRKLMKEFMYAAGKRVVSDVIGIPEWIDFKGHLRTMKNVGGQLDSLMTSWVEEHNTKKRKNDSSNEEQDFIDVLLSEIEESSMLGHTRDTIIKSTALILVLAGSETTSVSLTWMLSLLLNNRRTLKLAQEELDRIVGRHRWVEDTDIKNLVYLQAIAKETLRLYPPGPLSVPHEAMEDCKVGGFHVPKGTHLYVNLWKLHRDPNVWPDPEVFSPERFLTTQASVDAFGQHFEFIPFGAGRRICPGITLAFQLMHLTVARLIQGFELATPLDKAVDMTVGSGLTHGLSVSSTSNYRTSGLGFVSPMEGESSGSQNEGPHVPRTTWCPANYRSSPSARFSSRPSSAVKPPETVTLVSKASPSSLLHCWIGGASSGAANLVLAGSETTAVTLTWILSLLLNNRRTMKLAQEELDRKVGRHRWVEDTDIENLDYLQAIVKETLRLYPPAPLSVPHEAMEDGKVGGFQIPKGTHLFVNLWKLHRNLSVWPDPEVFSPERFLTTQASVDAFGQHFEFIPFGAGRRICPGIAFAFQLMHLTVARLIQGFELATPLDKAVDMTEGLGITMPRATALEVVLTPRLASDLYPQ
ncbi:hypothetical protein ACLB2K_013754 [Fragaria x ananassa]